MASSAEIQSSNWLRRRCEVAQIERSVIHKRGVNRRHINHLVRANHLLFRRRRREVLSLIEQVVNSNVCSLLRVEDVPKPFVLKLRMIDDRAYLRLVRCDAPNANTTQASTDHLLTVYTTTELAQQ